MQEAQRSRWFRVTSGRLVWIAKASAMKLYAISDLHLSHPANREALAGVGRHPEDWLILAGDVGETVSQLRFAFSVLGERFAQLIWVPGNHELWSVEGRGAARGERRYQQLVAI